MTSSLHTRIRQWYGREQGLGIRVGWSFVYLVGRTDLHDLAEVHHRHAVSDVPDHGEIMGDEHVRHAESLLQIIEQVHDTGLDAHVQGGNGFIQHDEGRVQCKCTCHSDSLTLSTGELVRETPRMIGRKADEFKQTHHLFLVVAGKSLHHQRLGNRSTHGHLRIERCIWILEDDLHSSTDLT